MRSSGSLEPKSSRYFPSAIPRPHSKSPQAFILEFPRPLTTMEDVSYCKKVGEGKGTAAHPAITSWGTLGGISGGRVPPPCGSRKGRDFALVAAAFRRASFSIGHRNSLPPCVPARAKRSRGACSRQNAQPLGLEPHLGANPKPPRITNLESQITVPGTKPSTQPGTPRWTHPLVSHWKQSPRVEPARNSIPTPWTRIRIDSAADSRSPLPSLSPFLCASVRSRLTRVNQVPRSLGGRSFSSDITRPRAGALQCAVSPAASLPSASGSASATESSSPRLFLSNLLRDSVPPQLRPVTYESRFTGHESRSLIDTPAIRSYRNSLKIKGDLLA